MFGTITPKDRLLPTIDEQAVIDAYVEGNETPATLVYRLNLPFPFVLQTVNRWIIGKYNYNPPLPRDGEQQKGNTTMAKKNKDINAERRKTTLEKIRDGGTEYGVKMDDIRGYLPELVNGEALIIQRQSTTDTVVLRLGDVSYS
jgi:hypothetical protein